MVPRAAGAREEGVILDCERLLGATAFADGGWRAADAAAAKWGWAGLFRAAWGPMGAGELCPRRLLITWQIPRQEPLVCPTLSCAEACGIEPKNELRARPTNTRRYKETITQIISHSHQPPSERVRVR